MSELHHKSAQAAQLHHKSAQAAQLHHNSRRQKITHKNHAQKSTRHELWCSCAACEANLWCNVHLHVCIFFIFLHHNRTYAPQNCTTNAMDRMRSSQPRYNVLLLRHWKEPRCGESSSRINRKAPRTFGKARGVQDFKTRLCGFCGAGPVIGLITLLLAPTQISQSHLIQRFHLFSFSKEQVTLILLY